MPFPACFLALCCLCQLKSRQICLLCRHRRQGCLGWGDGARILLKYAPDHVHASSFFPVRVLMSDLSDSLSSFCCFIVLFIFILTFAFFLCPTFFCFPPFLLLSGFSVCGMGPGLCQWVHMELCRRWPMLARAAVF